MKKYNVNKLCVMEIKINNESRKIICIRNKLLNTYKEILTGEIIQPTFPISSITLYVYLGDKKYLTQKEILHIYQDINKNQKEKQIQKEEVKAKQETSIENNDINKILELAAQNFFPKTGGWMHDCFYRSNELDMKNLPCHLRDSKWLAHMLKKQANLYTISYSTVLHFINNSKLFEELRHNYELKIVKWQINWIKNNGSGWLTDESLGGDLTLLSPLCDLGFRKGVLDTLLAIGMNREVIEEGLEKYANLWRDLFISRAFYCKYSCNFHLSDPNIPIPPIDENHEVAWIKYRKYEYYLRHKEMIDKYGNADEDMLMNEETAMKIKNYLIVKNKEREEEIENYKNVALGRARSNSFRF